MIMTTMFVAMCSLVLHPHPAPPRSQHVAEQSYRGAARAVRSWKLLSLINGERDLRDWPSPRVTSVATGL